MQSLWYNMNMRQQYVKELVEHAWRDFEKIQGEKEIESLADGICSIIS